MIRPDVALPHRGYAVVAGTRVRQRPVRPLSAAQAYVLGLLRALGPVTDEELADAYVAAWALGGGVPTISPSGLRTRRAELVRLGKVRATRERRRTATRAAVVWSAL